MRVIKPPRLRKGDLIGLVSPASTPAPPEKIQGAVRYLEAAGYQVVVGQYAASTHGYLAGNDSERLHDLNGFIRDSRVRAIFALRGGYGSGRLLPHLDYRALARDPKIISGFSDITGLQLALHRKLRLVTFSGPMPAVEFWQKPDPYTEENFWPLLTSTRRGFTLRNPPGQELETLQPGVAKGVLLGGNLCLVVSLLGTPFSPRYAGSLLVLEEVDEAPYRVDRMLAQLRNAGVLRQTSGLVLGQFTLCQPKDPAKPTLSLREVLREAAGWSEAVAVANFCYGHVPRKLTVPFGVEAKLDTRKGAIHLLEAAVA